MLEKIIFTLFKNGYKMWFVDFNKDTQFILLRCVKAKHSPFLKTETYDYTDRFHLGIKQINNKILYIYNNKEISKKDLKGLINKLK
jgi:hypothetical protein